MRAILMAALMAGALAMAPAAALAGDAAESHVLGFTEGLFAFEEYGVQDGSGFPYSNIYVVKVASDSWAEGTPIRVVLEEERATLAEARAEAKEQLEDRFADIFDHARAVTLAHSPIGEVESDPVRLAFAPVLPALPLGNHEPRYAARLELFQAETQTEGCIDAIGDRPMGLRLIIEREGGGSEVLSEDNVVPRSRGCPITYRISQIVVPEQYPPDRVAVLLSVFGPGFEGASRRFIAVTGRLP